MKQKLVFNDTIVVWWQTAVQGKFLCYVNGDYYGETQKTFFEIKGLQPSTKYLIRIQGEGEEIFFEDEITTAKAKKKLDVSLPPYNAVGDGVTLNTSALQKAFDDCDKNSFVYIPKGVFLTGSLKMHSNTELYIEKEGVLQGSARTEDYLPKTPARFEGREMPGYSSLLCLGEMDSKAGANCRNVVIRGDGKILGGGKMLIEDVIATEQYLRGVADKEMDKEKRVILARVRPRLIAINNCENVCLCGLEVGYGSSWNVHILYSNEVSVYNCTVSSVGTWNGDGIDPDSSTNVAIFGCKFFTGDDCIAIKSGKNPEGNMINRCCSNIYIFECDFAEGHSLACGSEISGGVENVYVWNCDLKGARWGAQIKTTKDRGGFVRNIHFTNCDVSVIAMFTDLNYNNDGESAGALTELRDFYFVNCRIYGQTFRTIYFLDLETEQEFITFYVKARGFDKKHVIENVVFDGVSFPQGVDIEKDLHIKNVKMDFNGTKKTY